MVEKVKGYGYRNIGFVLDWGYFSKENLRYMDSNGFGFIIMVKGCKEFISRQIRKQKGIFENNWGNQIAEFGVYGKTVHVKSFLYRNKLKLEYTEFKVNHELTKGDKIIGSIEGKDNGYLITSIPYDENSEICVDGEKVKLEKVNTTFLGAKIKKVCI